jgi:hypothetical protein
MSKDTSETLRLFFDIDAATIARDLDRVRRNPCGIASELASVRVQSRNASSPEHDARRKHLFMIQACGLCGRDDISPEVRTFFASFGAGDIAQAAEMVAAFKGSCADISGQMDVMRTRDGVVDDENDRDEGQKDYRELENKYEKILERVADTVLVTVLRRYHLKDLADLFESDRVAFEVNREIGRRICMPATKELGDAAELMDGYFRDQYGDEAMERVLARVAEIQRKG